MTLQKNGNVSLFDPFAHTNRDADRIRNFDFFRGESKEEKVRIEGTYCTVVTIGKKFPERKIFLEMMKEIDEIRKIFRTYFSRYIKNWTLKAVLHLD